MNHFIWLVFLVVGLPLFAGETRETSITPEYLTVLRESFTMTPHLRMAYHALAETDAAELTKNREKINALDSFFSNRIDTLSITDQQSSGRCWLFAGINILRRFARKNLGVADVEFSQTHLFFFDKLEKANLFLEGVIRTRTKPMDDRYVEFLMKNSIPDGGQWISMVELIRKYGVVPKAVFPETYSASHTNTLNGTLELKLKEAALRIRETSDDARIREIKDRALKDVYRILAVNFGEPPREFRWRFEKLDAKLTDFRSYTPLSFFKETIGVALDDYLCLCSVPTREFNRMYEIDMDKSVDEKPGLVFLNMPLDTLKNLAKRCILDKTPVWFACDVKQEVSSKQGLMINDLHDYESLYGMPFELSRKDLFETYIETPNHAMVLTGLDQADGKVQKWLVENSWGKTYGNEGFFSMRDEWFDFYVQMVVVRKQYVTDNTLKLFDRKPELLPPWDPFYRAVTVVSVED